MKTLIKILCLCLLWVACDSPTESEEPNEIDVDWLLVKTPNMPIGFLSSNNVWEQVEEIGYYFFFTNIGYDICNFTTN